MSKNINNAGGIKKLTCKIKLLIGAVNVFIKLLKTQNFLNILETT